MSSRLCVKNLPKHCDDKRLLEHFADAGQITDCKVAKTKDGRSRQFGFVGFRTAQEAQAAREKYNKSYMDTSKLTIEDAKEVGSVSLERPWSKYSQGSSRNQRLTKQQEQLHSASTPPQKGNNKARTISQNPQKRRKVAEQSDDAQLQEFLAVMQPRSQKALWANDDTVAANQPNPAKVIARAVAGTDDDSDEEDVFAPTLSDQGGKQKQHRDNTADEYMDDVSGSQGDTEGEGDPKLKTEGPALAADLQSDDAYLRSRQKTQLSSDDDDDDDDWDADRPSGAPRPSHVKQQQEHQPTLLGKRKQREKGADRGQLGPVSDDDDDDDDDVLHEDQDGNEQASEEDDGTLHEPRQHGTRAVGADEQHRTAAPCTAQQHRAAQAGDSAVAVVDARHLEPDVADTGRLFLRNLAYAVTEDDLRNQFQQFGELQEVHLVLDKQTGKSKGIAYIQYALPLHAVEAAQKLDATIFMGRLLHVLPARATPAAADTKTAAGGVATSFKAQREAERKADAGNRAAWNSLFMRQDTVAEAVAAHYGLTKSQLLDREAADLPLRMALGETHVINATKNELANAGVDTEKLEAAAVSSGKASAAASIARSSTTLLVKNLPYSATEGELAELLGGPGGLSRLVLPSTKTLAIVEYLEPQHARKAFKTLAYRRYHHVPIYLEWAPNDIFTGPAMHTAAPHPQQHSAVQSHALAAAAGGVKPRQQVGDAGAPVVDAPGGSVVVTGMADAELEDAAQESSTIYVKNLSWSTSDERLRAHFKGAAKSAGGLLRSCKVSRKKGPKGELLSMGFGFVECTSEAVAKAVLKRLQGSKLDRHQLVLQLSKKQGRMAAAPPAPPTPTLASSCSKVVVRNVAFEATRKEIFGLFSPFGHVKSCRVPRKFDGTPRGFAFVEMSSKQEAKSAMEGLLGTHLYGRRLVLEWAADDESLDDLRAKTAAKYHDDSMQAAVARGKRQELDRQ